ncbi:SulP family inorganic anion transporter [Cyclobacterium roseum]|uniref:SulP family inorganic anion transporter n=1 Tax=Cyclobacterium roseum TaxID=2666137 RepID=UPI001391D12A|nr:SulP family inorganic anion transporter [Cyclobacterium roseum]
MKNRLLEVPKSGLAGLRENWKSDLVSGFLVFLIALPLSLGISMASGFPPMAGIFSAVIGGLVVTFLGGSHLTIKGPAAGLIIIAIGAVSDLGQGDALMGYRLTLAVIVVAGLLQVVFGWVKSGILADFFPSAAVHGMLAAIGIIIIAKQLFTLVGVKPEANETLELFRELPHALTATNPDIAIIGGISLLILFLFPLIKNKYLRMFPAPLLVILVAIPMGIYFDLEHEHKYLFLDGHEYSIGPKFLVTLPENMLSAVTFPDFSQVLTMTSIKYIIMFALVGSLESLLSAKAVDSLDPYRRKSNMNRDLMGVGLGNVLAGMIGGLAMISEIVRSSANINNGAKTAWSNFFHGVFLLLFVAFFPLLIHQIPLAALAAMLVYTGYKLSSPKEFVNTYKIGKEQLSIFLTTLLVTLATDLLLGIAAGILLKLIIHFANGLPLKYLFKPLFTVSFEKEKEEYTVFVHHSAVFSNYINLKKSLDTLPKGKSIRIDFTNANLIDHTVMENLHQYQHGQGKFTLCGMSHLQQRSDHHLSGRKLQKIKN